MPSIGGWSLKKQAARPGEKVVWAAAANRVQGRRAVGGKLFLTDGRLLFSPNLFNAALGGKTWQVELGQVRQVAKEPKAGWKSSLTGGVRDRLKLVLHDGSEELFVINRLDEVINRLDSAIAGARSP